MDVLRTLLVVLLGLVVAAPSAALAGSPPAADRSLSAAPDLRVDRIGFITPGVDDGVLPHALIERDGSFRMRLAVVVDNDGRARAGASRLTVRLAGERVGGAAVPALGRGDVERVVIEVRASAGPTNIGWYDLKACADSGRRVGESDETNNCRVAHVALIPKVWNVQKHRLQTKSSDPGFNQSATITTRTVGTVYRYEGIDQTDATRPAFLYAAYGTVEETYDATFGTCVTTGEGSTTQTPFRNGVLLLNRALTHHRVHLQPDDAYLTTVTCDGTGPTPDTNYWQALSTWTDESSGTVGWARSDRVGSRRLYGAHYEVVSAGNSIDEAWDLRALIP